MTKLYAKIKGARAVSLFDFLKTWQVCCISATMPRVSAKAALFQQNFLCTMYVTRSILSQHFQNLPVLRKQYNMSHGLALNFNDEWIDGQMDGWLDGRI